MKKLILEKLKQIEAEYNVRVLFAAESGSRAWGFASADSDYDVRFIYVHPRDWYLELEKKRDVIELPINEELDINGWDLNKALRLLFSSNPTLFEWFASPIVYWGEEYAVDLRKAMTGYFSQKKGIYHYLSMAVRNYGEHLRGEMVRAKKYFYVLRPILACRWILDQGTQPPMQFTELMEAELDNSLTDTVQKLLDIKINNPEIREIPIIPELNRYLDHSISEIQKLAENLPKEANKDWAPLNRIFLSELEKTS